MSDHRCELCQVRQATTEIQSGWDARLNAGAGGGVYVAVCDVCYAEETAPRYDEEQ